VLKANGFQFEKKKTDLFDDSSVTDQLKALPKLQSQFNALCNCRITNIQRASTIIIRAYILLLKDSITIYSMISKIIVNLCDKFSKMNKKESNQFLTIYKLFVKETNAIIKIYDGARTISSNLPQIEKIDESIVAKLESTVGNNGEIMDDIDDIDDKEELEGTNKNVIFQTQTSTPKTGGEEGSESSGSSSGGGGDDQNQMDIFSGGPKNIQNTPRSFNPFQDPTPNETNNNNNDPFNVFGAPLTKTDTDGGFNPFDFGGGSKTTNNQNNKDSFLDMNLFGVGNTKDNGGNKQPESFNPFSNNQPTTTTNTNNNQSFNPFGPSTVSGNTQNQNNNPFL